MDTLYFLQHYWWALVALLGAIFCNITGGRW